MSAIPLNALLFSLLIVSGSSLVTATGEDQSGKDAELAKEYEDLVKEVTAPVIIGRSTSDYAMEVRDLATVKELSKHGLNVLPFIMEKFSDESISVKTRYAIMQIASSVTERKWNKLDDFKSWWKTGGKETPQQFATLYASWQKAVKELTDADKPLLLETSETVLDADTMQVVTKKKETDLGKIYRQIGELGIEILPILLDAAQKGDYTLLPLFAELSDNHSEDYWGPERRTKNLANWWEKNKDAYIIPFPKPSDSAPPTSGESTPPANEAPARKESGTFLTSWSVPNPEPDTPFMPYM